MYIEVYTYTSTHIRHRHIHTYIDIYAHIHTYIVGKYAHMYISQNSLVSGTIRCSMAKRSFHMNYSTSTMSEEFPTTPKQKKEKDMKIA